MHTRIGRLRDKVSSAFAVCLILGLFGVTSCERPPVEQPISGPTSGGDPANTTAFLRADPNPVPLGKPNGKTTISWASGSDAAADVYVGPRGSEKMFASAPTGSQDAPWIPPGSTEFRLYSNPEHKLLAELTVTMASSRPSGNNSPPPVSTRSP